MNKDKFKKEVTVQYRINERIRARQIRLIDAAGEQVGIVSLEDALQRASQAGLDLIEVAPDAKPPVCRLGDFGKLRYELSKKLKQNKKSAQQHVTKTVQFSPVIGENDLLRKISEIQKFIDKGYKVTVQVIMKGRQVKHIKLAEDNTIAKIREHLVNAEISDINKQENRIVATINQKIVD